MKKRKHLIIEEVDVNKAMEDTNVNMEKPKTIEKHVDLPPVYADAVEQHDEIKKNIGKELKSMSDIVKDKGIVPENPGTGKKVSRKPYTEQYQLDESLFEDYDERQVLFTEKRNNCHGEECANDKEARANRFAQKAAHKEKNDRRDNLEEYAELQEDERLDEAIPSLDSNKFWGGSTVKAEDRKNREKQVDEFAKHLASKIFSDKFIKKLDEKGYDTDEKKYEFYVKFLDTSPIKKENGETRHNDRLEKFILKDPEFNDKAHDMSGSIHNDLLAYTGGTNGTSFIPLRFIEPYVKYATDMMKSKFKDVINKKEQAQRDKDEDDALDSAFDESVENKSKKKLSESNELTVDEANAKLKERFGKGFKIKIEPYIEDGGEEWYCFWGSNDCYGYETVDEAYKAVCEYMFYKDLDLDESVNSEVTKDLDESFWDDGSAFRDEEEKQRWLNQAMGRREMASGSRNRQLVNNVEELLYEYDNGISDGYNELFKNDEELIDWTYDQIFDLKASGHGMTRYRKGICDDLKYLGRDFIFSEIKRIGHEIGVVEEASDVEESVKKCPDCGKEICECDKKEMTEAQQPDIFECPICHRNFTLGECEHDDLMCQCPRCHSQLIKTDNGEYTEYNESLEEDNDDDFDEDDESVEIDGKIFRDMRDAKRWLDQKTAEYGNTYFFPKEDRRTLNKLIDAFGNTYFWYRLDESSSSNASLEEDFNLTMSLSDFEPWTEIAKSTWNKVLLKDGALEKLEDELELQYPKGISEESFNRMLERESEWVLKASGVEESEEDK